MKKGNTLITTIVAIATLIGGSGAVGFMWQDITNAQKINAGQGEEIASIKEAIKCIPEMKSDIRETRDNMIKLMASQGISPIKPEVATSTALK